MWQACPGPGSGLGQPSGLNACFGPGSSLGQPSDPNACFGSGSSPGKPAAALVGPGVALPPALAYPGRTGDLLLGCALGRRGRCKQIKIKICKHFSVSHRRVRGAPALFAPKRDPAKSLRPSDQSDIRIFHFSTALRTSLMNLKSQSEIFLSCPRIPPDFWFSLVTRFLYGRMAYVSTVFCTIVNLFKTSLRL